MKLECNFQGQKKGPAVWGVEGGERVKEMTLERVAGTPSYQGFVSQDKQFGFSSKALHEAVLMVKNDKGYEEKEIESWGQSV